MKSFEKNYLFLFTIVALHIKNKEVRRSVRVTKMLTNARSWCIKLTLFFIWVAIFLLCYTLQTAHWPPLYLQILCTFYRNNLFQFNYNTSQWFSLNYIKGVTMQKSNFFHFYIILCFRHKFYIQLLKYMIPLKLKYTNTYLH